LLVFSFFDTAGGAKLGLVYFNLYPMKPHLVAVLAILSTSAFAQNKTLGVGTTTNNPNAALHVESPTNNQGFIMPRLSTVQRTSMSLATPDAGLMVYDKDINKPYFWDGSSWLSSAGLSLPFTGSSSTGANSFDITNIGIGGAGYFSITNTSNGSPSLTAYTAGTGNALRVQSINPANNFAALDVDHAGTGYAASLLASNPGNTSGALNISYAGSGYGISSDNTGNGIGMLISNSNPSNAGTAFIASHDGMGFVGQFMANNAANNSPALYAALRMQALVMHWRSQSPMPEARLMF
jgi:hypothetical protein